MSNTEKIKQIEETEVKPEIVPKYSIITVNSNGLKLTSDCINSILANTKDFELIVVDNCSDDGSRGYLEEIGSKHCDIIKLVYPDKKYTFAQNNNMGLKAVHPDAEFIIFLNNDIIVCKDWLQRMENHFDRTPLKNIAAVGPVSSSSNGRQMVGKQDAEQWHSVNEGKWSHTGVLFGWCMMYKKAVIDEIGGFDERFENSHEDNDLCLRTTLAGYNMLIAYDTYIDHLGQGTLRNVLTDVEYTEKGEENRQRYHDKWYDNKPKKLVAVYRTNWGIHLEESLKQTSKFADNIIIHFCRVKDGIDRKASEAALCLQFPKICKIGWYDGIFQEDYERNWLLQEALALQKLGEADWCISIDDDEIYEDKFIAKVQRYMNPRNPEVLSYGMNWRTIWKSELGKDYYRADSTFGHFINNRMFKLIKNQEITSLNHPEGHHCGSAPIFAPENIRWTNIRVKHLGYDTPEQRQRKYEFYEANDHFKRREDIGNDDYSHLISRNVVLQEYDPNLSISFVMMVKDEQKNILQCLEQIQEMVDEYIIIDTGSTDKTLDIVKRFAETALVPVHIHHHPWVDNYSIPRNYGKSLASGKWILRMDADERFAPEEVRILFNHCETDQDFVVFHVLNYMEKLQAGVKPKYASTEAVRMYRNIPEFFYTGIIHETLDDSLAIVSSKRKLKVIKTDVLLHHYGYLKPKPDIRKKVDYYEKLNEIQIKVTEETDARPYFNLAMHYLNDDKEELSLGMFQKALKIEPKMWHASQQMAALNMKSAKVFLGNVMATIPEGHTFKNEARRIYEFLDSCSVGAVKVT